MRDHRSSLNAVCPYFTMFPVEFPQAALAGRAEADQWVADPFCGRGTTNYASRVLGLPSIGIDSSPVAAAIAMAKLADTSPSQIVQAACDALDQTRNATQVPDGDFWRLAYHPEVLQTLCRLRESLVADCASDSRRALRAIVMGALHGPQPKTRHSYLSNQCQRTYAPKPAYAVRFWRLRGLEPPQVDVLAIISERAVRYYGHEVSAPSGEVVLGDSRDPRLYERWRGRLEVSWVVTSPPYLGVYTYLADQWLRLWFVGGEPEVDYSSKGQLRHKSAQVFADELRRVWANIGSVCARDARMVFRFGAIRSRNTDARELALSSLVGTGWEPESVVPAGNAGLGRRQALHFKHEGGEAPEEFDVWASWHGWVRSDRSRRPSPPRHALAVTCNL